MAGSIKVDPQTLKATASKVDSQVAEYRKLYANLYRDVDAMKAAWQGKDNQAFTGQIDSFRPEFEKMSRLMDDYSQFLRKSADIYQRTQDEITNAARKL